MLCFCYIFQYEEAENKNQGEFYARQTDERF
jgi:hypothetical protein